MNDYAEGFRAYTVTEPDEDRAIVTYGRNYFEARRLGTNELSLSYDESVEVKRTPEFDGITDPQDLARAQLSAGWWFTCGNCERRVVDEYGCDDDDDTEEGEEPVIRVPVVRPSGDVYCSAACCISYLEERRSYRENHWNVVAEAVEKWPGIEVVSSSGITFSVERRNEVVGDVEFRFPGGQYLVRWCHGDREVSVSAIDAEAWKAFVAGCKAGVAP